MSLWRNIFPYLFFYTAAENFFYGKESFSVDQNFLRKKLAPSCWFVYFQWKKKIRSWLLRNASLMLNFLSATILSLRRNIFSEQFFYSGAENFSCGKEFFSVDQNFLRKKSLSVAVFFSFHMEKKVALCSWEMFPLC